MWASGTRQLEEPLKTASATFASLVAHLSSSSGGLNAGVGAFHACGRVSLAEVSS